ncbi:ESPR-type extended signal peptide-containing protein [Stenotrophomonas maltophilia]|uniref:ESPR-type extended signal peptide-containing protein n=1 Tax=Stenotrophomonas maltophilia TaxID=40324 RepID=UPI001559D996|nr:ESPR-type extended signal peptide-containing protein [Stenotrophomonas maltophilia]
MNRIYRRIWNAARQCWVVASELAVARRCGASRRKLALRVVALSVSTIGAMDAGAVEYWGCDVFDLGKPELRCAPHLGQTDAVPYASSKLSTSKEYLIMGGGAYNDGSWNATFGHKAKVLGNYNTALGQQAYISGVDSVAVGYNATAQLGHSTVVGANAYGKGIGSTAFGNKASATRQNSIAIGSGSLSQSENSVAIGANSLASEVNTVSVGSDKEKRRIVNVADGRITAASTDAVTGKQLYATNSKLGAVEANVGTMKNDLTAVRTLAQSATNRIDATTLALGRGAVAESGSYGISTAIGNNAKAYNGRSVALGFDALAGVDAEGNRVTGQNAGVSIGANTRSANGAVATGFRAIASGNFSIAVGGDANAAAEHATAMGYLSKATAKQSTALGRGSEAKAQFATALGNLAVSANASAVALGDRANARHDNAVALGAGSVTASVNSVSVGSATLRRKIQYIADGTISNGSTDAITGNQLFATNQAVSTAQSAATSAQTAANAAKADATKALAETTALTGLVSQTAASGNVRLGGKNSGTVLDVRNSANASRKVTGVADGTVSASSNEAVNGKQLNATNVQVAAVEKAATAAQADATVAKADAAKALVSTTALEGLVNQTAANGNVRLGEKNSGTVLDVRNSANASRKVTGVADGTVSASSNEAINGKQLNATNVQVAAVEKAAAAAQADATVAKADAAKALVSTTTLEGLVSQVAVNGNVRLGEKNSGTVLDVRNSANANRKLTGVAEGVVSGSSYEAVNGRQLNATNEKVVAVESVAISAAADATLAKADATKALAETAALGGLVAQVSASGDVRLGEKNGGTTLNVRNSANADRKISGVADGALSASSAEAVSGRQLYSTNSRVSDLEDIAQFVSIGSAPLSERAEAGVAGVALGNSAKTGLEGGTAVGTFAEAMGKNSTAIGRAATVSVDSANGFAMGVGAQVGGGAGGANDGVAIGAGARVSSGAHGSLALGNGSQADEGEVASFGGVGVQRRLVNIARGTADHNATTVSQLKDSLATLGGSAGMDASGNIVAPTYSVQGGTQNTVEDALMALDGAVITAGRRADKVEGQLNSIFRDSPSARGDGMNQIALSGANGMVLTNLADGRVAPGSSDAVTGNQLYAAEQKISQNRNDLEAMRKEREMGQQTMRGLHAGGPIDFGGARLTGVAEAGLSADSSDVVRGSQLFRTNEAVASLADRFNNVIVDHDDLSTPAEAAFLSVAVGGDTRALGEGSTSVGSYAASLGKQSTAIGYGAHIAADALTGVSLGQAAGVFADWGVALGSYSRVEVGARFAVAVGAQSIAETEMEASFGHMSLKRRLTNIANGTANHNAATVGQLRGALSALGGEVDANGNIVGPSFTVQGQSQSTLNGALEALDGAVVSNRSRVNQVESQLRSVFQDTPSVRADGLNQLTLAGTHGMVISNVANGLVAAGSRDAVNGGQLHSMQQQLNGRIDGLEERIDAPQPRAMAVASAPEPEAPVPQAEGGQQVASVGEGEKPAPQPKSKQDETPKPQVDTAELEKMLARANEYTDGAISSFERRLDKMDKRFNRMAAMSSAQTAMAMNTAGLATYNRLGAGVGYSEGESAMAVGYQRVLNEKGSATFSLNGAFTNSGERSMGVGVGIGW